MPLGGQENSARRYRLALALSKPYLMFEDIPNETGRRAQRGTLYEEF